ncbi:VC0807 family protein [Sphaerisporangium aureirubrum]|uniref:VC0807 family protein n=1 Tax=Sphaerisporangium aureirubrum TaxID=1544736 RepID=A0ABW1NYF2_9ACTN
MTKYAGRRDGMVLLVDIAISVALFYVLRAFGVSAEIALVASSLAPGFSTFVDLSRRRRPNTLTVFMFVIVLLAAAIAFATDNTRVLLARDGICTAVFGAWMLLSARGPRPLAAAFTRMLLDGRLGPGRPPWDELWERLPRFRRVWRVSTVMWGIGLLLDAVVRLVMAITLPVDAVPGLNALQYAVFMVLMQVVTSVYLVPSGVYNQWSDMYEPLRRERARAA